MKNAGSLEQRKSAAVKQYLDWGWVVLPLAPTGKRLRGKARILSSKLPASMRYFFRPISRHSQLRPRMFSNRGIGVRTGRLSGLVVLDVDGSEGQESIKNFGLPNTRMVKTGNGVHYYFQHPGPTFFVPNAPSALAEGVDVKGESGHVVVPPTRHASGIEYQWINPDTPIAPLPEELLQAILALPHRPRWKVFRNVVYNKYFLAPLNAWFGR